MIKLPDPTDSHAWDIQALQLMLLHRFYYDNLRNRFDSKGDIEMSYMESSGGVLPGFTALEHLHPDLIKCGDSESYRAEAVALVYACHRINKGVSHASPINDALDR